MTSSPRLIAQAKRLRFEAPLETQFLDDYFEQSIVLSRAALAALLLMWSAFGVLDIYALPRSLFQAWALRYGLILPLGLLVLGWSFHSSFRGFMQTSIAALVFAGGTALIAMTSIAQRSELGALLYYAGLILAPLCGYSFLRLRFWYATIANVGVLFVYIVVALWCQGILLVPQGPIIFLNNVFFVAAANIAGMATCYTLEFSARRAFVATKLLEYERLDEQRKRERTEAMLHVLSQAIGGVIHDLGTPLTSVQGGVQTMELLLDKPAPDMGLMRELVGFVNGGAQMLNVLRLSLMEQTRAIEGKPVPVELRAAALRPLLETSIRHQNPRFRANHALTIRGADCELLADEMKLITVFMNLVANAFKYSDGEVCIEWRVEAGRALIAISDQGTKGYGLTQKQAQQLFTPFGRLDAHANIEGTGLGLLSAHQIVEAHNGEVFIEGTLDGTSITPAYSTACGEYPFVLPQGFRTAFVVACPVMA